MTFQIHLDVWLTFVTTLDIFWGDGFDFLFGGGGEKKKFIFQLFITICPCPSPVYWRQFLTTSSQMQCREGVVRNDQAERNG